MVSNCSGSEFYGCELYGSELLWFGSYKILSLGTSELLWFRTYMVPNFMASNLYDSELIRTFSVPNFYGSELLWPQTFIVRNSYGPELLWFVTDPGWEGRGGTLSPRGLPRIMKKRGERTALILEPKNL